LKFAAQSDTTPRAGSWWPSELFDRWIKSSRPGGTRGN
jgi:hypothetical protein